MSINVNAGGVRQELKEITANAGGVKQKLLEVRSNAGGVRQVIFQAWKCPDTLTWRYAGSTAESPAVSDSGFRITNSKGTALKYRNIISDEFELIGKWKISATVSGIIGVSGSSGAGGMGISADGSDNSNIVAITSAVGTESKSGSITVGAGKYRLYGGGGYGNQSGSFAAPYVFTITFEKVEE